MDGLIMVLGLVLLGIGGFLFFLFWVYSSICELGRRFELQATTLEALRTQIRWLQGRVAGLEKGIGESPASPVTPAAAVSPSRKAAGAVVPGRGPDSVGSQPEGRAEPASPGSLGSGSLPPVSIPGEGGRLASQPGSGGFSLMADPDLAAGDPGAGLPGAIPVGSEMVEEETAPISAEMLSSEAVEDSQVPAFEGAGDPAAEDGWSAGGRPPSPPPIRPVPVRETPAEPSWSDQDLESLIGGDIMNKVGALLLIIGLGLFLSYSMGSMGPWAKLAMGAVLSVLLLAWGVIQDARQSGRLFAVGLIGAGWAGLYLTAYSAHALEATKVIDSPAAGMSLMLLVAAGMIAHAIRFGSETATGMAFLLAFIALFNGQVSLFTEGASVVLSISLVIVAAWRSFDQLAVTGAIMTYVSMLLRFWLNAPPSTLTPMERLQVTQGLLLIYWVSFELLGMLFMRRHSLEERPTRALFAMNASFYLVLSLALWPQDHQKVPLTILAGLLSLQYVVSAIARGTLGNNPGEAAVDKNKMFQGSAEDAAVVAVLAVMTWLWYVLPASLVALSWGVLALVIAEIAFRLPWQMMRFCGHALATIAFFRTFLADFPSTGSTAGISHRVLSVVPMMALMLHLHFRSREEPTWDVSPTGGSRTFSPAYLYFACALGAFLLRFEFGPGLTAPLWSVAALGLTFLGRGWKNEHLRRQGFLLGLGTLIYGFSSDLQNAASLGLFSQRWFVGPVTIVGICGAMVLSPPSEQMPDDTVAPLLDKYRREGFALIATFLIGFLLYLEVSGGLLTLAWSLMGAALLGAGFGLKDRFLRLIGLGTVALCVAKVFLYDTQKLEAPLRILAFICLGLVLIGISWVYSRFKDKFKELF